MAFEHNSSKASVPGFGESAYADALKHPDVAQRRLKVEAKEAKTPVGHSFGERR